MQWFAYKHAVIGRKAFSKLSGDFCWGWGKEDNGRKHNCSLRSHNSTAAIATEWTPALWEESRGLLRSSFLTTQTQPKTADTKKKQSCRDSNCVFLSYMIPALSQHEHLLTTLAIHLRNCSVLRPFLLTLVKTQSSFSANWLQSSRNASTDTGEKSNNQKQGKLPFWAAMPI